MMTEKQAERLIQRNPEIMGQLDTIRDRDLRKAATLYAWEVLKAQYRDHEIPMKEDHVNHLTPVEVEFNNRSAPPYRTYGSHPVVYYTVAEALKVYKDWTLVKVTDQRNPVTRKMNRFRVIKSPKGKLFAVSIDKMQIQGYDQPVDTPYVFMMQANGKARNLNLFHGRLGWARRQLCQQYRFAKPESPYFGYRGPHLIALIALLLDGESINIQEKDLKRGKKKLNQFLH